MELVEQLLLEKSRRELIQKSVSADKTKAYGTTRWDRRDHVSVFGDIRALNKIDMNAVFKGSILNFIVPIHGETNDYSVEILFEKVCEKIKEELKRNRYKLEYKVIYRALINAINSSDVLVSCTCPDFKYRQSYQATKGQYNAGKPELRPAKITNPNDSKGAGCKHIMNVIGNLDWAMKLAISINNYILYMKDNHKDLFADIIWPAISGLSFSVAEEEGYFGDLANTMPTLDSEGQYGDVDTTDIDVANDARLKYDIEDDEPVEEPEDFDNQDLGLDSEGV